MLRFMFPEDMLDWYTWRIASMVTARSRSVLPLGSRCVDGSGVNASGVTLSGALFRTRAEHADGMANLNGR